MKERGRETSPLESAQMRWYDLMSSQKASDGAAGAAFEYLVSSYEKRPYHNLEHVQTMLSVLDKVKGEAKNYDALRFAVWFHDVVYDANDTKENEEKSAKSARKVLTFLNVTDEDISEASRLILITKEHVADENDPDGKLLIDADFAILGQESSVYASYSMGIREEYKHVPDALYNSENGRVGVLNGFLQREQIFQSPVIKELLEEKARENIQMEIDFLMGQ